MNNRDEPTLRAEMHKKKIMKMAEIILDKYDKKEAWNRVALVAVISVEIEDLLAQVEAKAREEERERCIRTIEKLLLEKQNYGQSRGDAQIGYETGIMHSMQALQKED